ncbi:sensor histidine kinase [Inconstantimicrobium porci]|nr:HAMP domain-containing sensor histidine kinase [Inconstantimicrobium porci]MDD6769548.1 HAMP domain-containing sensor histidine kinase [Inconstantimicrobium porci]
MMFKYIIFIGIIIVAAIAILIPIILIYRRKLQKIMYSLSDMLDSAIDGTFTTTTYDESSLSALESKMSDFLESCSISSNKLKAEKESIKCLISDISHQAKTPVSNIILYSQILSEHELSEESAQCVKVLTSQSKKLDFLMQSLVKISRLESGIITINPQANKVQPLIDKAVAQIELKAKEKNIKIEVNRTTGTACYDSKWTVEALYNVIDNAVKYSPCNSTIKINPIPYNIFFRIDIVDQGIGISEDEKAKIFSRFYRSVKVQNEEGVGIGLFLTQKILTDGGGYIKVSKSLKKGSIFSIFLPIKI